MTITWTTFAIRLLIGFFLAVGIGIERQWLKNRAVLKINVLVALGSEMFMMLSIMTPGDSSPTRIAAQIVSGVGFLGGGVILREGGNVIGINTAATLWCAAAIGALVGSGFLVPAYLSTFAVISANLLARPLEKVFKQLDKDHQSLPLEKVFKQPDKDHQSLSSGNMKLVKNMKMTLNMANDRALSTNTTDLAGVYPNHYQYCCNVFCFAENEILVFELINQFVRVHNLTLMRMQSKNVLSKTKSKRLEIEIKVNFTAKNRGLHKSNLEEIIKLLKTKAKVNSISLQLLPP
jgi:putative Mg2+ transporter-C (MgtC) family protein